MDFPFNSHLYKLKPYAPIEPIEETARQLGIDKEEIIKLDANENLYGKSINFLNNNIYDEYYLYPDPLQKKIRALIAKNKNLSANEIVVGAGADDILDILCRLFLKTNDKVLVFSPTFSYYYHILQLNNVNIIDIPRDKNFHVSLSSIPHNQNIKVALLCSPNNPTGNIIEPEVLELCLQNYPLVILDEAYVDFADKSYISWRKKYAHLIIVRTFSKAFALAGLRIGYGVMHSKIAETVMKVKQPYNINYVAEQAIQTVLLHQEKIHEIVEKIKNTRQRIYKELISIKSLIVYPSHANFLFMKLLNHNAKEVYYKLRQKKILVRFYNDEKLTNFLRVSIGTDTHMDIFIKELKGIINYPL